MWTSPNKKAFQAICAHWVDSGRRLCKALLALPKHRGRHSGEEQAAAVIRTVEDYGIINKIGYFTGDNHGLNNKMNCYISKDVDQGYSINWDPVEHRIRCHGHVINLAVQAFMFAKDKEAIDIATQEIERNNNVNLDETLEEKYANL
jgi:hypothetical protein